MHHIITIEHGDDLHSKAAIHEKMLCEHSLKLQRFSTRAERQRECYDNCDILLDRLGSITMVNLTPELYEERKLGAKVSSLCTKHSMESNDLTRITTDLLSAYTDDCEFGQKLPSPRISDNYEHSHQTSRGFTVHKQEPCTIDRQTEGSEGLPGLESEHTSEPAQLGRGSRSC